MNDAFSDTLAREEAANYRAHAVNSKFKQQLAYGIGAATVFGLVSVLAKTLFDGAFLAPHVATAGASVAAAGGIALGPVIGLIGLGIVGVGLLYLSAKYLSENTLHDQALQAKQISAATRGHAPSIAQAVEPVVAKVQEFPDTASKAELPTTTISNERELADTVMTRNTLAARGA